MGHFVISPEGAVFLLVLALIFIVAKLATYAVLGYAVFAGLKSRANWGRPMVILAGAMMLLLVLAEFIPAMIHYPATLVPPLCEAHFFFPLSWGGGASNVITPCYTQPAVFYKSASLCRNDYCLEKAVEAGASDCDKVHTTVGGYPSPSGWMLCYFTLAQRTGNYSYCDDKPRDTKLTCYADLGKRLNDTAVCERLPPGPWKTDNINCIYSVLIANKNALCGNFQKTGFRPYCAAQRSDPACHKQLGQFLMEPHCLALDSLDASVCEIYSEIQSPELADICAREVAAISGSNLSACEGIPPIFAKDMAQCIHQVNMKSESEPDCMALHSDILQEFCMNSQEALRNESCDYPVGYSVECVALFSNDSGLCELLSGNPFDRWSNPSSPDDCKRRMERAGK